MKKSVSNLILTILLGSAILTAGISSGADGKSLENNFEKFSFGQENFSAGNDHNSEFWSKFRESVMPDEKNTPSNRVGNDNAEPQQKFPRDKKN